MFAFLIKKSFFDMWDNFIGSVLINFGFVLLMAIPFALPFTMTGTLPVLTLVILGGGVVLLFLFAGAASMTARDIAEYEGLEWKKLWAYFKDTWITSLLFGIINVLMVFLLSIAFPIYTGMGNLFGTAAAAVLFWAYVIWLLAAQFFFPVRAQLDKSFGKIMKKCFILFFDNTGYALGSFIVTVFLAAVSVLTAFLIPGLMGVLIWLQGGVKLRLYKYDYLEEHPDASRRTIPWDALLVEDQERVGKRSLKGMIFPWKE
ncbi:MAG: hypothetical protein ACOCYG_02940 [Spirochaetota bacterium]